MSYTPLVEKVILVSTIPSNLALDAPVNEEKKKFNLLEIEQVILVSKLVMHGYSWLCMVIHGYNWLCMVIVGYSWFSNLALDAPVNEETKRINLLETEQKAHSDTGL